MYQRQVRRSFERSPDTCWLSSPCNALILRRSADWEGGNALCFVVLRYSTIGRVFTKYVLRGHAALPFYGFKLLPLFQQPLTPSKVDAEAMPGSIGTLKVPLLHVTLIYPVVQLLRDQAGVARAQGLRSPCDDVLPDPASQPYNNGKCSLLKPWLLNQA